MSVSPGLSKKTNGSKQSSKRLSVVSHSNTINKTVVTVPVQWRSTMVSCHDIPRYNTALDYPSISDVAFSSEDPNTLYLVMISGETYSVDLNEHKVSQLYIDGFNSNGSLDDLLIWAIHCHKGFIYLSESSYGIIYQCEATEGNKMKVINRYHTHYMYSYCTSLVLDIDSSGDKGLMYYRYGYGNNMVVLDIETMEPQNTLTLSQFANSILCKDKKIYAATSVGVYVYNTDGTPTGKVYLEGEECLTLTANKDIVFVGMVNRVAVVNVSTAADTAPEEEPAVYYIGELSMAHYQVECIETSLAMLDTYGVLTIMPWEKCCPPFTLASLCISALTDNKDALQVDPKPLNELPKEPSESSTPPKELEDPKDE